MMTLPITPLTLLMRLPRPIKQFIMVMHDTLLLASIAILSWCSHYSLLNQWPVYSDMLLSLIGRMVGASLLTALMTLPMIQFFGLYRAIVRYLGEMAVVAVCKVASLSALLFLLVSGLLGLPNEWPIVVLYGALILLMLGGSRFLVRSIERDANGKPNVIIYGAGRLGVQLLKALSAGNDYRPVAMIDDDARLQGQVVDDVVVYRREQLPHLVYKHNASQLLLAVTGLAETQKAAIISQVMHLPVEVRSVPSTFHALQSVPQSMQSSPSSQQLPQSMQGQQDSLQNPEGLQSLPSSTSTTVPTSCTEAVEPPVMDQESLANHFRGQALLILGAGSLVGTAIAEWCMSWHQGDLLLVDPSESLLVQCKEKLLYQSIHRGRFHPQKKDGYDAFVSDSQCCSTYFLKVNYSDEASLLAIFERYSVNRVFCCVADQHVVMNEENVVNVVQNNVLQLESLLTVIDASQVEYCLLVSSDKAIRPTSVVGATRRLQESLFMSFSAGPAPPSEGTFSCAISSGGVGRHHYVEQISTPPIKHPSTRFAVVRMGNLLESEHSVLDKFRRQILSGGPVTVTHPEAQRYYLSINDAVQMIMQTASMMQNGDVYVLDAGQPIRILDLAYSLIQSMGYRVGCGALLPGDIEVRYIGLRPGEKLFEEPLLADNAEGTLYPRILKTNESMSPESTRHIVVALREACNTLNIPKIIELLELGGIGFRGDEQLHDLMWLQQQSNHAEHHLRRRRLKPIPS